MREIETSETEQINGGISGHEGAVLTVLGAGAAITAAPISAQVVAIALGTATGLALAQAMMDREY